jgi:fumarate hydratase, class I
MPDLSAAILELIRLTSTSLPSDVENALNAALEIEAHESTARNALQTITENIRIARKQSTPLCQDTGTPIFYVHHPEKFKTNFLKSVIREAVAEATGLSLLRPNAVDGITGKNSGNNLGDTYFPIIHFDTIDENVLTIDLMLKGGGCENVGRQYSLPNKKLNAGRDLDGVRIVALDAVFQAQGLGCAPGFLGIAVGGDRGTSFLASKEVFFNPVGSHHPDAAIAELEKRITWEANQLGIGPMGFGGKSTILGTRITGLHRLPASFFVTVSFMCWAYRRRRVTITDESVRFS